MAAASCDTRDKPGTVALGQLLKATYPGTTYGISRSCGSDALPTSEHYDGRAVDWFTNVRTAEGKARGNALVNWLTAKDAKGNVAANARRLGVMYIIWNNRIWGAYSPAAGWRPYSSCATHPAAASDTTCHRNHVHLSLSWEGAMRRTSWWTKTVARQDFGPCRVPRPELGTRLLARQSRPVPVLSEGLPGQRRFGAEPVARDLLRDDTAHRLHRPGRHGSAASGRRRARTAASGRRPPRCCARSRPRTGSPANGLVDVATWRSLLKATAPVAKPAPKAHPWRHPGAVRRVREGGPEDRLKDTTVKVLQKALGLKLVDGDFGPQTKARGRRVPEDAPPDRQRRRHHARVARVRLIRPRPARGAPVPTRRSLSVA